MLVLRHYMDSDAGVITQWLRNEYAFRQWSADRYESYQCMGETWNCIEMEVIR